MRRLGQLIESHAIRTAIYAAAALACLYAGRTHVQAAGHWPRKLATPASFWLSLSAVLFVLSLAKLFELQHLVGVYVRDVAREDGFYDVRRAYQRFAIYVVVGICLVTFIGGLCLWARRWFVLAVPLSVIVVLLGFVTIRAISLHDVDTLLYRSRILGADVGALIEVVLTTSTTVLAMAVGRAGGRASTDLLGTTSAPP
jgi:hypothetical protein